MQQIPFVKPTIGGEETQHLEASIKLGQLCGGGDYSLRCSEQIAGLTGCRYNRLVSSCSSGLDAICLALGLMPGDEVIMPSFTFPSTANAVALRGGVPVFVDIRPDTMNIDEEKIEAAITGRTKAIIIVHYAGVSCAMDRIIEIAGKYNLYLIEDAAQAVGAYYKNRHLGTLGDFAAFSFHATKNINCGEGGAVLVNRPGYFQTLCMIIEKGTNREAFRQKLVNKYQWQSLGSSYVLSELQASFLYSQLLRADELTAQRLQKWAYYYDRLYPFNGQGFRLAEIPSDCQHNGHIFYVHLDNRQARSEVMACLSSQGIQTTTHFEPLHLSPAGKEYCRASAELTQTNELAASLLRLPLWNDISESQQDYVVEQFLSAIPSGQDRVLPKNIISN